MSYFFVKIKYKRYTAVRSKKILLIKYIEIWSCVSQLFAAEIFLCRFFYSICNAHWRFWYLFIWIFLQGKISKKFFEISRKMMRFDDKTRSSRIFPQKNYKAQQRVQKILKSVLFTQPRKASPKTSIPNWGVHKNI
jgi:hypothetical protein